MVDTIKNLMASGLSDYYKLILIALIFLLLSFDLNLGLIYIVILVTDFVWRIFDKDGITFPISSGKHESIKIYTEALVALGVFLGISTLLVNYFQPQAIVSLSGGVQSVFSLLSTLTPLLKGNAFLTFLGWGVAVAIIETVFLATILEGTVSYAEQIIGKKVPLSIFHLSRALVVSLIMVSIVMLSYHLTAKALVFIPLLITFIFFTISSLLIIYQKQSRGAIFIHIVTNSLAVFSTLHWI